MPRPSKGYYLEGENKRKRIPGVTTIIGIIWDSYKTDNMLDWATRLATENLYWKWERNRKGLCGSITHELFTTHVTDTPCDLTEFQNDYLYDEDTMKRAMKLFNTLKHWYRANPMTIVEYEVPMVHSVYHYGGTPDLITEDTIRDLKTGFIDQYSCGLQLASYQELYYHKTRKKLSGQIIGFDQNDAVITVDYSVKELEELFKDFLKIKDIYRSKQKFGRRK